MENRHHYRYVIIDSSKENHNNVDAKFKVQIPEGITGTTRVCVKSFSMPNSYHNIYGDLKTAKFVEFFRPTSDGDWVYEVVSFNLAEGYTEADNLFSELQSKFTNASGNEITVSTKDICAVDVGKRFSKITNVSGHLTKHTLQSGILGVWQEYLVPMSTMVASSGYAFQLELFLNEDAKVMGSTNTNPATYSLEEVSFDVELVEVSDAIMADINSELAKGAQIKIRVSVKSKKIGLVVSLHTA
jgi:hypothetical protein